MSGETPAVRETLAVYAPERPETDHVSSEYRQTEVGLFPKDWEIATLEERSSFITKGSTPTTYGYKWETDGVLFLRSECVAENGLDLTQSMFISDNAHAALRRSEVDNGDLLITITGNVGKVIRLRGLSGPANINQHIARVRIVAPKVYAGFTFYFLSQPRVRKYFGSITTGQAYPQISLRQVRDAKVYLPSLREQRAIATALSDVDALISALDKLIAKKRVVKIAAMQRLLTGRQRLPEFSREWQMKRFAEIASIRRDRVDPRKSGHQKFCIELEHIEPGTGRLLGSTSSGDNSSLKSVFQAGDVLFGKLRPYLRKYWLVDRSGVCSTEFWVLSPDSRLVVPAFLFQIVSMDRFVEAASTAYGTHMPRADWNVIKSYDVPLPSLKEQTAIATVLSDMDAEIEALEARREKTRRIKQGMMQELLTGRTRLV